MFKVTKPFIVVKHPLALGNIHGDMARWGIGDSTGVQPRKGRMDFPDDGDRTHGPGQCASKGERPDGLAVALNPVRSRLARAATMSIRWFKALPPGQWHSLSDRELGSLPQPHDDQPVPSLPVQHGPDEVLLSEVNRQLENL